MWRMEEGKEGGRAVGDAADGRREGEREGRSDARGKNWEESGGKREKGSGLWGALEERIRLQEEKEMRKDKKA